ncbi:ABC transporter ATP-binding protein [Cellvibrio zantedeschiae]|uniref:ABC transporter ATP-binding protein n=1 Tax=Cellvibrio zantedeschiae TaxID=1237077 RepID=A0ABQ3BAB3_9GAMM|nr:ABC transporter ATP-binding protein [Cellvibrio zantedeschiae]GGY86291.1 ABC transporter ATP-binding protein [Cellvibrio zantedeschiae]
MIKLNNIQKIFRTDEIETMALSQVSFEIKSGEFVAIMGPSGCGKSTLLNILGMLDSPDGGEYEFNNENIAAYPEAKLSQIRKQNIGFIFQSFNLIDELNVFENIELALLYHKISAAERKQRVQAVIEKMEIQHRAKHMPSQLSGGQQQRVAVARALVANPKLILADEPTGNLDSARGQEVMSLLKKLNQEGSTIIMVTHSAEHAEYAQRRINLFDGKVVAQSQLSVA